MSEIILKTLTRSPKCNCGHCILGFHDEDCPGILDEPPHCSYCAIVRSDDGIQRHHPKCSQLRITPKENASAKSNDATPACRSDTVEDHTEEDPDFKA